MARAQTPAVPTDQGTRTAVVAAGAHYRAGWLRRVLLGAHYRDLWKTPVRAEVLDLGTFAGGLRPLRCTGRRQTPGVRFEGTDGRQYQFRSTDKDPTPALPPELRATLARDILQDHISSAHPAAPLMVAPLLEAVGVLHAAPRLMVFPDDPRLKGLECVASGALPPGRLGTLEVRPTAGDDDEPGFAGASEIADTKRLFDRLEGSPRHRVDGHDYLAARLLDLFVGDWDRHQGQWRWARFDEGGLHRWRAIPQDRDWAFPRHDGWLVWIAGFYYPMIVSFGEQYSSVERLAWSGQVLDRRLLTGLEGPAWDSVAAALAARLTDSTIAAAARAMPPEYYARHGARVERALRRRRDRLPQVARGFYALLAGEVDVHGTDEADVAAIDRLPGARLRVQLTAGGARYYERTFQAGETQEVRLYLHGGDDRVVVRGNAAGPTLRVTGGGGDDVFLDSALAGPNRFYDHRDDNRFERGPATAVDRSRYDEPPPDTANLMRPRDWGARAFPHLWVGFAPDIGLFLGGGVTRTAYGFRQLPYRSKSTLRAAYATSAATYRAEFTGEHRGWIAPAIATVHVRASGLDVLHFFGFGNETPATQPDDFYKVHQEQYLVQPALAFRLWPGTRLAVGPVFKYARTSPEPGSFLELTGPYYGAGEFAQLGGRVSFGLDSRDLPAAASRGVSLQVVGTYYPEALDVKDPFASLRVEASTYLSMGRPAAATLALRVGGAELWGTVPFHEVAYVGGATTVRGYTQDRFAGGPAVYGNAELRLKVADYFLLLPGELGVFGLADAGRVYLKNESSDRWHAAAGGGLWFAFLNRANTLTVAAARSPERTAVYVRAGFLF